MIWHEMTLPLEYMSRALSIYEPAQRIFIVLFYPSDVFFPLIPHRNGICNNENILMSLNYVVTILPAF
jgi:hypothetical protein